MFVGGLELFEHGSCQYNHQLFSITPTSCREGHIFLHGMQQFLYPRLSCGTYQYDYSVFLAVPNRLLLWIQPKHR